MQWKERVWGIMLIKQKGIQSLFGKKSSVSKADPWGVCAERVGYNSILCAKCRRWVHRRCSDVPRQVSLLLCWDVFICRTCLGYKWKIFVMWVIWLVVMVNCWKGSARISSAWKKFRELSGVLVVKQGLSLKQRGKIYQCFVRLVWLYCCETWEQNCCRQGKLA